MTIRFDCNPVNRNTKCSCLWIGPHLLYISYDTIVAYSGPFGSYRTETKHSRTTARHMHEMGCDYPGKVSDLELDDLIDRAIADVGATLIKEKLRGR